MTPELQAIARQFSTGKSGLDIAPLGKGLINDTYRVSGDKQLFVLQRINAHVFPHPKRIMSNLQQLSQHIRRLPEADVRLKIPSLILTTDGEEYFQDEQLQVWRALEMIQPAESRDRLSRVGEAAQIGFALAHFHRLCINIGIDHLHDTLPGFHNTPAYFLQYQNLVLQNLPANTSPNFEYCRKFIDKSQKHIDSLETAKSQGRLAERVIHGDPKLNNFLFKPDCDQIISLIDLDTVKPGLVHYDIGDCLRSCCHIPGSNQFNLDYCQTILKNYLSEAGQFFTTADYDYLYPAIFLIPLELGIRYFSDYLQGNPYFKVQDSEQNLRRAAALFQLCEDIDSRRGQIEKLIASLI